MTYILVAIVMNVSMVPLSDHPSKEHCLSAARFKVAEAVISAKPSQTFACIKSSTLLRSR